MAEDLARHAGGAAAMYVVRRDADHVGTGTGQFIALGQFGQAFGYFALLFACVACNPAVSFWQKCD